MARVKKGVNAHKRHKKVLKMAKGYYGAKSKTFRAAKPATMRARRPEEIQHRYQQKDAVRTGYPRSCCIRTAV